MLEPHLTKRPAASLPLQASKWLKLPILIDEKEMEDLMTAMGDFWIIPVGEVAVIGKEFVTKEAFLEVYSRYLRQLKLGDNTAHPQVRSFFSSVFTNSLEALYTVQVNEEKCLVKVERPVIQLQGHRFDYSTADETFRSMVFGVESVSWGIQFSYPHLFQDEKFEVQVVRETEAFPNTVLFKTLQRWVREHTIATPFEVKGKRINVPFRLGKNCFEWVNTLPQLLLKNLRVIL